MTARRLLPPTALGLALIGVVLLLAEAGGSYVLNARFSNAGGLVKGGLVEVAGQPVGSVSSITLTPDGEANVELTIDEGSITPLHEGTRADIRQVGAGTITNNYVLLSPGAPTRPTLPSGAVLPTTQTSGIVAIDALLDSFGPSERRNFDDFFKFSGQIYAGSGSGYFNHMLAELDPALGQLDGFTGQLALDRPLLSELVRTGAAASTAIASRQDDLRATFGHMAAVFGALVSQRQALGDALGRLPAFLDQGRVTLARVRSTLIATQPALHDTPAAAGPLRNFLAATVSVLPEATPLVQELDRQLPEMKASLDGLVALERPAVIALHTLGPAMKSLFPVLQGFRYYGTDLVLGVFGSVLAMATGEYNGNGHYLKVNLVQSPQTVLSGSLAQLLAQHPLDPGVIQLQTGLLRRCPGGSEPPAPDGSSPWILPPHICTPSQDLPLSVNFP